MRPKDKSVSAIKMVFLFLSVLCGQRGKLLAPEKFVLPVIYHVVKCFKKKNHNPVCTHSGIFLWFKSALTDL